MRKTRLSNFISERSSEFLLHWYKEAKKTHDIRAILTFKSFVIRMIEAQDEFDRDGVKMWISVDDYIRNVLGNEKRLEDCGFEGALGFILDNVDVRGPFNYERKKHFLRLL